MLYIIWISFRLRNVEQKFVQNEMRLESTGQNYLSCAAIHSTAYCLNAFYTLLPQCILQPTASMHSIAYCLNAFYSLLPQYILQPTASMHSTAYFLPCGFLQVFGKTLEEHSKTGVSLFIDD